MKFNYIPKIILLVFVLICASIYNAFAQSTTDPNTKYIEFDIKKMLPTSPEAAMLGKFGEVPIGYYTGTADISVPLYSIKQGDLNIPVILSYHSSGVKVEDEATWVGLSWNLEPGGAIVKIINGKDDNILNDDLKSVDPAGYQYLYGRSITGVYSQTFELGYTTWQCNGAGPVYNNPAQDSAPILNALIQGQGQPDIFQYTFPGGYSGKFYINPKSRMPVLIDKKDSLFIQPNTQNGWTIKTLNGDKYVFNSQELSYDNSLNNYAGQTWKLTQIILNNGKVIDFSYTQGGYSNTSYNETYHDPYLLQPISSNDYGVVKHYANPQSTTQILTQIKTDNVIVNFNLEDRQDIGPGGSAQGTQYNPKRLRSVDVLNRISGALMKTFKFSYGYFVSSSDPSNTYSSNSTLPLTSTTRLRLDSLREVGYTNTGQQVLNPAYTFTYNTSTALPAKASFARDFWGYYNGKINNMLLPNLNYFYYSDFDNYKNVPLSTLNAFNGANRTVDTSKLTAGILTKIKYPTGGYTSFKYEANDFSNYSYPDVNAISSNSTTIYVSDQNNPTDHKTSTFMLSSDQTVQFSNYIQSGPPNAANNFDSLLPSIITLSKIVSGTTTVIKQWVMSSTQRQQYTDNGGVISWINDPVDLKANTSYTIAVELPDALGAQNTAMAQASVTSTFTYFSPAANVPKISFGGGVRVAGITNYDNTGALINNKTIRYINTNGTSSGKLMSNLAFLYSRQLLSTVISQDADVGAGDFTTHAALANVWYISSQSVIPYANSAGGNPVGYSRVEEYNNGPNAATNGKHIYYYYNSADQTKVNLPNIPNLMNGLVAEEDFLTANGDTVKKVTNNYGDHNVVINPVGNTYTGAKIFSNFIGADPCFRFAEPVNGLYNYDPNSFPAKYEIDFYPINSAWYLLNNKETKDYNNGKVITSTEGYVYNRIGQQVRDSTLNSRGELVVTRNLFPADADTITNTINRQLVDSCFFNNLLEQHHYKNNVETFTKVSYAINNNQLVRSEIDRSYNNNPLFIAAKFDQYGPNKTLRQVSEYAAKPSSLLWDQTNTFIICETTNALLADVAYSGFEMSQSGNWTIGSAVRNTFGAAGIQSYNLSNGAISKAGLTAATTYIVSYWTQNGAPLSITGTLANYPVKGGTKNGWTFYEHRITGQAAISISGTGNIDDVRLYPKDAQMTTYTYDPLVGMTSMTDAKGETTTYEYDGFQRLITIRDKDGNIVKHIDYHYQGQ